jgi:two-component system CheB/CheR fusion protein
MTSDNDPQFETLLQFLRDSRGFDFTGYKRSSLMRRVDRRMQQVEVTGYGDYLDYLQLHQDEFAGLFNTILINVTGFFRDTDAWLHLRDDVLPGVIAARKPSELIRVWSAGCASGEEAYTAAAILADLLGPEEFRDRVKIYATDVDEEALSQARLASYPESALKSVPDQYRDFFVAQNGRYAFRPELRRSVIFGRNDLIQDAPISRVDVLLCRNTLMYFNAEAQSRIVNRFHFAMNDSGVLFLGKAEMLLSHTELFQPTDLKRRFFRKVARAGGHGGALASLAAGSNGFRDTSAFDAVRAEGLADSPVATMLVTADGLLAFANQRAEAMFGLVRRDVGRPFRDLDVSYRPVELRAHIDEVMQGRRAMSMREVELHRGAAESLFVDIDFSPLVGDDGTGIGVALYITDVSRFRQLQRELELTNRQLETAYEELQSTVEELETTNEELQSTVEELETTNEELQSTNEELETMNEELQSTNDELQTINDELRDRTQEVHNANAFLEAVLRSLTTGVIVVDTELKVTAWNRRAEDMWGLRSDEAVEQHLLNLDIGLPVDTLKPLVRATLAGEQSDELRLTAVNRRGRDIRIRVCAAPLTTEGAEAVGAIILIDEESA